MRKWFLSLGAGLAFFVSVLQPTKAQSPIIVQIGTQHFTNGSTVGAGAFNTTDKGQPAPFNMFCGSDTTGPNCSATWTFNYAVPSFTIYGASLTLGILDIDSAAPGNQVASFTLNGSYDLTSVLNAASEGLNGGTGAPDKQYDVLTITIPASDFAALAGGSATFALTLQGQGLAVPTTLNPTGLTRFNGAGLDFSTLDIESPELSCWMLFLTGMLLIGIKLILSKLA
jgi:hypothetical protein